jgi:glycosyltransferase involved in cell wall biosynthesis
MIARADTPWLSVVMPVYNGAATLEASLASLVGQGSGIEVVLVDQGSTDDSVAIAERFRPDIDINIISAPKNKNWMQNTNQGFASARAPMITMLHQDDIWLPDRAKALQEMAALFPDAVLWAHGAFYIDATGRQIGRMNPPFGRLERQIPSSEALLPLLVQNTLALPAVMFRRDDARRVGGLDEKLWYTADWDFWLRLTQAGPLAWNPAPLVGFRLHSDSLTLTGSRNIDDFRQQLAIPPERHIPSLTGHDKRRVARLASASNAINVWLATAYHGRSGGAFRIFVQIAAIGPLNWRRFLRDTQIIKRVMPRLKLKFGKGRG